LRTKEVIKLPRQQVWGKIAVLNFALGGSGAGFYVLMFLLIHGINSSAELNHNYYKLIAPTVVGFAFLVLAFETRFPVRILYLINHFNSSWMSRETLFGATFILFGVADFFIPHIFFRSCAIFSAFGYLMSQSCILYCAKAVPTWHTASLPVSIFFSSIYGGAGWLVLTVSSHDLGNVNVILTVSLSIFINILIWLIYISNIKKNSLSFKLLSFRFHKVKYFSLAAGLLLPIVMLVLLMISVDTKRDEVWFHTGARVFTAGWIIGFSVFQKSKTIKDYSQLKSINLSFPE
jgi:DMSO reductase anchor subunit